MDIVQISHLRAFANAVASALQAATDHSSIHAAQMHDLLGAVDRSVAASSFMAADHDQQSEMLPALPAQAPAAPPKRVPEISQAPQAAVPADIPQDGENKGAVLSLQATLAARFFVQIPWGGHAVEARLDTVTPRNQVVPDLLSKATAIGYFALLPWSSAKINTLSVGAADDHQVAVHSLQTRIGQPAIPAFITHALPGTAMAVAPHAPGFFAAIPWAGRSKKN